MQFSVLGPRYVYYTEISASPPAGLRTGPRVSAPTRQHFVGIASPGKVESAVYH